MTKSKIKLTYEQECYLWASAFYLYETLDEDFS